MEEGYITIATNSQQYIELALNFALSVKHHDVRPVALLHDNSVDIPEDYKKYFDKLIEIRSSVSKYGNQNKINLFDYSPFERSMFVDADSLMAQKGISVIWNMLKNFSITVPGTKKDRGKVGSAWLEGGHIDIAELIAKWDIPYIVSCSGALVYFDKGDTARLFFQKLNNIYMSHADEITKKMVDREGDVYSDSILFGFLMGYFKLEPFPRLFRRGIKTYQCISSVQYARDYQVDILRGVFRCRWENIDHYETPIIAHFARMRPNALHTKIYLQEANKLRKHFGVKIKHHS